MMIANEIAAGSIVEITNTEGKKMRVVVVEINNGDVYARAIAMCENGEWSPRVGRVSKWTLEVGGNIKDVTVIPEDEIRGM